MLSVVYMEGSNEVIALESQIEDDEIVLESETEDDELVLESETEDHEIVLEILIQDQEIAVESETEDNEIVWESETEEQDTVLPFIEIGYSALSPSLEVASASTTSSDQRRRIFQAFTKDSCWKATLKIWKMAPSTFRR